MSEIKRYEGPIETGMRFRFLNGAYKPGTVLTVSRVDERKCGLRSAMVIWEVGTNPTPVEALRRGDHCVLVDDLPDIDDLPDLPAPAKAERTLAPGWIESIVRRSCAGCGAVDKYFIAERNGNRSACEACADSMGVWADAPPATSRPAPAVPSAPVAAAACIRCAHAGHVAGTCPGKSPTGEYGCPCGEARKAERGTRVVGVYHSYRERPQDWTGAWSAKQTGVAPGLASERIPTREPPRVRDIYLPGVGDDVDGLPNLEMR